MNAQGELYELVREAPRVGKNIVIVRDFLNHKVDVELMDRLGDLMASNWESRSVDIILTAPSSGICPAYATACHLHGIPPIIYAKEASSAVVQGSDVYQAEVLSATRGEVRTLTVIKDLLPPKSRVLVVDDFLARGNAMCGLLQIVKDADCELVGVQVVVEKPWQEGRKAILDRFPGTKIDTLVRVQDDA